MLLVLSQTLTRGTRALLCSKAGILARNTFCFLLSATASAPCLGRSATLSVAWAPRH